MDNENNVNENNVNENMINGNINNLNKAASYINSIYDKQSYTDLYGSSILIVIISTIVVLIAVSFSLMQQNKVEIAAVIPSIFHLPDTL